MLIQRRSQKIIEECPSPAISEEEREKICDLTIKAFKKLVIKVWEQLNICIAMESFISLK